jgi:hypothetical protein
LPGAIEIVYDNYNAPAIGTRVRHIVLTDPKILQQPAVKKLTALALKSAKKPLDPKQRRRLFIKSISAKQRPRRP